MKSYLIVIILLLAVALGGVILYRMRSKPSIPQAKPMAKFIPLRSVQVLGQGDEFDLELADGRRAHGRLPVRTAPNAKKEVVRVINATKEAGFSAKLLLIKDGGETWTVDLFLRVDGKDTTLTDWLRTRRLVWEQ
jgi:hypothetical protein